MCNTMPWYGPYKYRKNTMQVKVESNRIGNYILGHIDWNGQFVPKYVGRSDHDLQSRLIQHVNDGEEYEYFMFAYASTVRAAYETECRNYHEFENQLVNERHPDRPDYLDNSMLSCPVCGQ